jgi:uncharacterized protein (TIGR03437 family)
LTLSGSATSFSSVAATTSGGSWLQAIPATGTSPGAIQVALNSTILASLAVGTYNGSVTVTPTSGVNLTPIAIPVTLSVTGAPPVTVSPTTVNLNFQIGGLNNTTSQNITLATTGTQAIPFSSFVTVDPNPSGQPWISVSPSNGSIPANGNTATAIGYDATKNLPASVTPYSGKVTIFTPGGAPSQQDVSVKLLVSTAPVLNVPGTPLTFNYQVGGATPAAQSVTATSSAVAASAATGQMTIGLIANTSTGGSWLSVPPIGVTGTPFSVSVNPAGLTVGSYSGTISINGIGAANNPQTIPVTLTVANDAQIVATVSGCSLPSQSCTMLFPVQTGQAAPAQQTVSVTTSTGAALNYTATTSATACGGNWLILSGATSASTAGAFGVSVNGSGVAAGSKCEGSISIAAINPVTGASAPNSPLTIPVTMYVSTTPLLSASPAALRFSAPVGGAAPNPQTITVASTSLTEQLNYTVSASTSSGGPSWLLVGPLQGSTFTGANVITVAVQSGLLSAGTYNGTVTITATTTSGGAVADSPITVPVAFTVNAGALTVSPTTLTFTHTLGGAAPAAQTISIGSSASTLNWSAAAATSTGNWLTVSPANGTTPGTVSVTANGAALSPGIYNGTVTIASPSATGSPATVNVQLTVLAGTISASPTTLTFNQAQGGPAPATQNITVSGTPGTLTFTVSTSTTNNVNWLSATPASGSTPGTVTVSVNAGTLGAGQYTGSVRISATSGANGSPIDIPVTLNVVQGQTISATPSNLSFNYTLGTTQPTPQTVQLTSSGGVAPFSLTTAVSSGGAWLSVTPTSGSTPAVLSVSVTPAALVAGTYAGTITVTSTSSMTPVATTINVNLTVAATVPPVVTVIRNNASYALGAISPGENIVIGGTNLGPTDLVKGFLAGNGVISTLVSETQVTFDGIPAPIIYTLNTQTSVMVPYEVAGRPTTTVHVIYKGVQSAPLVVNLAPAAPGIYTLNQAGTGPGAILNGDYSLNEAAKPAAKLSAVAVYMTGEGVTSPVPLNGAIAPLNGTGLFQPTQAVTATVGGVPARVLYYGSAPGIVYGVMQVNIEIPANAPSGAAPLQIFVGGTPTQIGVTVAVQ